MEDLSKRAVINIFGMYFDVNELEPMVRQFDQGLRVETRGSEKPSKDYVGMLSQIEGLGDAVDRLGAGGTPALVASATEFILEGLHLNRRLNRDQSGQKFSYHS